MLENRRRWKYVVRRQKTTIVEGDKSIDLCKDCNGDIAEDEKDHRYGE